MNQNLFESAVEDSRESIQKLLATARKCARAGKVDDARRLADKAQQLADESMKCAKSPRDRAYFQVLVDDLTELRKQLRGKKGLSDKNESRKKLVRGIAVAVALVFTTALIAVLK